jgi:hypothetical protein
MLFLRLLAEFLPAFLGVDEHVVRVSEYKIPKLERTRELIPPPKVEGTCSSTVGFCKSLVKLRTSNPPVGEDTATKTRLRLSSIVGEVAGMPPQG